ncbi:IS110 family transposase, partial [bacterium]|nr:IS110 family transposase [bacterium]
MTAFDYKHIDQFRQIKKEIRGSSDYLIVGIDVAKDKHFAFFGDANGHTILRKLPFENTIKGFEKLIVHTEEKKAKFKLNKVVFGLEPTANYHKSLGEYLITRGYSTVLVGAGAVKNNRELIDGRWDKNDIKDSANVADLVSQGKCLYYDTASEQIRQLRSLLSLKRKVKKQEHSTRMRIRNHLVAQFFPELDGYFSSYESGCHAIIEHCFDPKSISPLEFEAFSFLVTSKMPTLKQQKWLKEIWQLAKISIGCKMTESVEFEASMLVGSLRQIRANIKEIDKRIKTICLTIPEYKLLLSIPGFGETISAMTLGAIGDYTRFENGKQLLKMVGLDLSASRSGKSSQNITPKISKKGKSELRYALYQAAMVASSRNIDFMAYFTDKIKDRNKEKGIKTKMRVKLAAKMLIIAWTL